MRQIRTVVIAVASIFIAAPIAHAQYTTNPVTTPPPTFAGSIYSAGAPSPRATYDDRHQSVFILDSPGASAAGAPMPATVFPPGTTYSIAAVPAPPSGMPRRAPPSNSVYTPGQPPRTADASQTLPPGAVAYSTIDVPTLPPGAVLADCADCCEPWHWQLLPAGLMWHSYLAGPKEPRMATVWFHDPDLGAKWDGTLGARVALLRNGTSADFRPDGWELQVEGAAFVRQDPEEELDVDGYDFRIGIPLIYGMGPYQMKLAWYHTSAHLGDEFAAKHPDFTRINFSRNALVWGHSYFPTDNLRLYGEIDFGYWTDGGNEPWAFQFGFEYSPVARGWRGAPFLAANAHLREEVNFGGTFTLQTGWQWRPLHGGQLIRAGFHYLTGPSTIDEFFRDSEQQVGGGLWYDF